MSDGPWKREEADPVTWVADWTDQNIDDLINLQAGSYAAQAPGQPKDPSPDGFTDLGGQARTEALGVTVIALVVCGLIGLTALAQVPPWVVLMEIGVVIAVALLFILILMPRWRRKQRAQVAETVRSLEAETVTLSAEGIHVENSTTSSSRKWAATSGFFRAKTGLGIWFEGGGGIIVPTASLPSDVDEAELVRRIELWRGNA